MGSCNCTIISHIPITITAAHQTLLDLVCTAIQHRIGPEWNQLTSMVNNITKMPITALTCISGNRQYFVATHNFICADCDIRDSICIYVIANNRENELLYIPSFRKHPKYNHIKLVRMGSIGSYIGLPITVRGYVAAVLCAVSPFKHTILTPRDRALLVTISQHASILMEQYVYQYEFEQETVRMQQFFSTMSHEIRTPLAGLIGYANLLADLTQSDEHQEYTSMILSSSDHLRLVVDDMLDYLKLNNNSMSIQPVSCNLRTVIEQAFRLSNLNIGQHLHIWYLLTDNVPVCSILDQRHLIQIVINVLSNGIKFTPSGGNVYMVVKTLSDREAIVLAHTYDNLWKSSTESYLQFDVIDTGLGIPLGSNVFEPFVQTHAKQVLGGTGLGLTIAQQLVRAMGGYIWHTPATTQGTRFSWLLPLVPSTNPCHEPDSSCRTLLFVGDHNHSVYQFRTEYIKLHINVVLCTIAIELQQSTDVVCVSYTWFAQQSADLQCELQTVFTLRHPNVWWLKEPGFKPVSTAQHWNIP